MGEQKLDYPYEIKDIEPHEKKEMAKLYIGNINQFKFQLIKLSYKIYFIFGPLELCM